MAGSLVEAALQQQLERRDLELQAPGRGVRNDARIAPAHVRGRATFQPVRTCACGCGRALDPRNDLGFARTCVVAKLQVIWRRATPELRARLLELLDRT